MQRGEGSDAYGLQISQLGEFFCDACLDNYFGAGFGDYSMLRKGHAPSANHPWIGRSRDLSWMRKGPIGVTRREALLAAEEAKAALRRPRGRRRRRRGRRREGRRRRPGGSPTRHAGCNAG